MMFNRVSADGYFASNDGQLDWVVPDDAIDQAGASRMHEVDTMLFGRRTYDAFESSRSNPARASSSSRSLCGFGAHEVASAFLSGTAAIEKRISRGKKVLATSKRWFDLSDPERLTGRMDRSRT